MSREPDEIFSRSYITLCRKQRQLISTLRTPEAGDWLFGPNGVTMAGPSPEPEPDGAIFLPRLDQLIRLLRDQAAHVIVSCYPDGYSCQVMDADDQALANVISKTPEEAALRALVFVLAERAANQQAG
jgi:hypothetical protein